MRLFKYVSIYETYSLQTTQFHESKYMIYNFNKEVFLILSVDRVDLLPATWTFGLIGRVHLISKEKNLKKKG